MAFFHKENIRNECPKPITTLHTKEMIVICMYIIVVGMHANHFTSSAVALAHILACNYKGKAAPLALHEGICGTRGIAPRILKFNSSSPPRPGRFTIWERTPAVRIEQGAG